MTTTPHKYTVAESLNSTDEAVNSVLDHITWLEGNERPR